MRKRTRIRGFFREQITALCEGYEVNPAVYCAICCCLSPNDLLQGRVRLAKARSDLFTVNTSVKLEKCVAQTFKSPGASNRVCVITTLKVFVETDATPRTLESLKVDGLTVGQCVLKIEPLHLLLRVRGDGQVQIECSNRGQLCQRTPLFGLISSHHYLQIQVNQLLMLGEGGEQRPKLSWVSAPDIQ